MKKIFKKLMAVAVVTVLLTGCVNENFDDPKSADCVDPSIIKNKEVADIYAVAINPAVVSGVSNALTYTSDDIFEAYVVSSDEGGNFYKKMYLQPTDGSKGFLISLEGTNLYTKKLEPGRKVYVKLKGLAFCNPTSFDNGLTFGAKPTDIYWVDRLGTLDIDSHIIPTCTKVDEETIVHGGLTVAQAKSTTYLNTLVELKNVQFKSFCSTYSLSTGDTSLRITDGTTEIDVRTSKYATFAGNSVPYGNGTIRGVLSKYGSTYQLVLRTERDVKLTNPRVETVHLPKVGNAMTFSGTLNENFESYATTTGGATLPKYINDAVLGDRYWDVTLFSGNKYLQMTAFGSGCNKSLFYLPVDFTAANKFSFQSKAGFSNGPVLNVYYILASDYTPGGTIDSSKLVNITSKFTISPGLTSGYPTTFTSSGDYLIPASLSGNGYFIFEYDGTLGYTTTLQLDNIVIN